MGSPSSRRKNASGLDVRIFQRLLQDGVVLDAPDPTVSAAALQLQELELVEVGRGFFLRCANRRDPDFPPPVRDCQGLIWLNPEQDVQFCLDCDRPVHADDPPKHRFEGIRIRLRPEGVMKYLENLADNFESRARPDAGVLRFRADPEDILVCVPEFCVQRDYLSQETIGLRPTVLVTVEPSGPGRLLPEPGLVHTTLAALVAGQVNLGHLLQAVSSRALPPVSARASIPVYAGGARPIVSTPTSSRSARRFALHVTREEARVEGIVIAGRKARVQLLLLQILAKHFMRSILALSGEDPTPISLNGLTDRLQRITREEKQDRESVRKTINRLQETIQVRIRRKLGLPIGREDIIETIEWKGQADPYGYRLNPQTVVIGHPNGPRA